MFSNFIMIDTNNMNLAQLTHFVPAANPLPELGFIEDGVMNYGRCGNRYVDRREHTKPDLLAK